MLTGPEGQDYYLGIVLDSEPAKKEIRVHGFELTDLGVRQTPTPPRGVSAGDLDSGDAVAPQASVKRTLIDSFLVRGPARLELAPAA